MKNSKSKSTNNTKKTKKLPSKVNSVNEKESVATKKVIDNTISNGIGIEKIVDGQGVSLRSKNDNNPNRSSRFGVTPTIFYDTSVNFKNNVDELEVVTPHNAKLFKKAIKNATNKAYDLENQAILEFDQDIRRAKFLSFKNLEIARVEALRILTKAVIIEKNHHEQIYEKKCHEEALKNIAMLKEAKLILNDKELAELLVMLKHDYELELKNNEIDFERVKVKIDELQSIYHVKRQLVRQQIKELNQGKNFNIFTTYFGRVVPSKLISEIKKNKIIPKSIYAKDEIDSVEELGILVKTVDIKKLSSQQQKLFERFISLLSFISTETKYLEKNEMTKHQLDELAFEVKQIKKSCVSPSKRLVFIDEETTKNIVNARKQSLIISKPANLYAVNIKQGVEKKVISKDVIVKTKTIEADLPQKIDPSTIRQPITKLNKLSTDLLISKKPLNTKTVFADNVASQQMTKFKKLQGTEFDKNKHIKYETIEYTNYKWEWKTNALENRRSAVDTYYSDVEYQTIDAGTKTIDFKQLFKSQDEKNIIRLKKLVANLPEDPIVVNNLGAFKKENINVEKTITEFKSLTEEEILDNSKNEKLIRDIEMILVMYNELSKTDAKYRQGIIKAQAFDRQLAKIIKKQDTRVCKVAEKAIVKYNKNKNSVESNYQINLDSAKNQYLINKELIIDEEQSSYAKEEEIFLWNSCVHYKKSNDFMNQEYKYENNIISGIIDQVVAFNKTSNNPIPLTNIPSKILPLPIYSNARIDISLEKFGSNQFIVAHNTDHKNKLLTKHDAYVDLENVRKIYVLDKFRAVKDIKTKVALLTSYANIEYLKSVEANKAREAREIKLAQTELDKKLAVIDRVYTDIDIMSEVNTKLTVISADARKIQEEYINSKIEQWKIHDKGLENKSKDYFKTNKKNKVAKKISLTSTKEDLDLLKQEKSKARAISLEKKTEESKTESETKKTGKKMNFSINTAQFQNFFKRKKDDEITIDEIIGKK